MEDLFHQVPFGGVRAEEVSQRRGIGKKTGEGEEGGVENQGVVNLEEEVSKRKG